MDLTIRKDWRTGRSVYTLTLEELDLVKVKLHPFDYALIADCDSPDRTIADKLLALELIARRIEESDSTGRSPTALVANPTEES